MPKRLYEVTFYKYLNFTTSTGILISFMNGMNALSSFLMTGWRGVHYDESRGVSV